MSRDTLYQQLRGHLAYLKLAAAAEALPAHLEAAHQSQLGHTEFLEQLLRVEVEATEQRRWNSRMRFANFPNTVVARRLRLLRAGFQLGQTRPRSQGTTPIIAAVPLKTGHLQYE